MKSNAINQYLLEYMGYFHTPSEISKLPAVHNRFPKSMTKGGFERMKPVDLREDRPSSNLMDWGYRIIKNSTK